MSEHEIGAAAPIRILHRGNAGVRRTTGRGGRNRRQIRDSNKRRREESPKSDDQYKFEASDPPIFQFNLPQPVSSYETVSNENFSLGASWPTLQQSQRK